MSDVKQLRDLIKKEKMSSSNPRMPRYSTTVKDGIVELAKQIPAKQIVKELGISRSFIGQLKKRTNKKTSISNARQTPSTFQFLQMNDQFNSFVKDESANATPTIRLKTESGVTIEIFS